MSRLAQTNNFKCLHSQSRVMHLPVLVPVSHAHKINENQCTILYQPYILHYIIQNQHFNASASHDYWYTEALKCLYHCCSLRCYYHFSCHRYYSVPSIVSFLLVHFLSSWVISAFCLIHTTVSLVLKSTHQKRNKPIHRWPMLSVFAQCHRSFYSQQTTALAAMATD